MPIRVYEESIMTTLLTINIRPNVLTVPGTTPEQAELCNKIINVLRQSPYFDHPQTIAVACALGEFAVLFEKDHGLQSMWDYIGWALAHKENPLTTIMHDINGRGDRLFAPRTSGYLGIKPEEYEA